MSQATNEERGTDDTRDISESNDSHSRARDDCLWCRQSVDDGPEAEREKGGRARAYRPD